MYKNQNFNENNNDLLGLIAQKDIKILHKGWPRYKWIPNWPWEGYWSDHYSESNDVSIDDITINAALFALNGSFSFEDYDEGGEKGNINFTGSMVQKNRGPIGQFGYFWFGGGYNSGYKKNYKYDPRMAYETPPHFLEPENAGWEIMSWQELF